MALVLIVLAAWVAVDALLLGTWLALVARRKRTQARAGVRAAERYANRAPSPRPAARGQQARSAI